MDNPVRIIIADDHAIVVDGLSTRFNGESDMTVVATASNGTELLARLKEIEADIVVLDLHMAGDDGFTVLKHMRAAGHPVKTLILTAFTDGQTLQKALILEADGIVLKTDPTRRVVEAVRAVAAGQVVYPRALHNLLLRRQAVPGEDVGALTPREEDVLALLAEGLTNQEIAARLELSNNTVKYHLQNLYGKLQVTNRTEAARRYLERC